MTRVIRRRAGHSREGRPGIVGFRGEADPSSLADRLDPVSGGALYGIINLIVRTPSERFWSKVDKTDTCWLWMGTRTNGYGRFTLANSKMIRAHRWAYEQFVGPIPEGLTIDHLCRVRHCVNPEHLEPVTLRENVRRGFPFNPSRFRRQASCPNGHPYTEETTKWYAGKRMCRICYRARRRGIKARRREKLLA